MKKSLYTKALLGMTLSLSGCMGVYEGGFECPPGKGVGCKSISDVNQMVDQGELPETLSIDLPEIQCERCGSHHDQQIMFEHLENPQIWYLPSINIDPHEKRKVKAFDDSISI